MMRWLIIWSVSCMILNAISNCSVVSIRDTATIAFVFQSIHQLRSPVCWRCTPVRISLRSLREWRPLDDSCQVLHGRSKFWSSNMWITSSCFFCNRGTLITSWMLRFIYLWACPFRLSLITRTHALWSHALCLRFWSDLLNGGRRWLPRSGSQVFRAKGKLRLSLLLLWATSFCIYLSYTLCCSQNCHRQAHTDQPLREGNLHISAPHIYGSVLEALELRKDTSLSFLNAGSGTGYLTCIAATILGPRSSHYCKYIFGSERQKCVVVDVLKNIFPSLHLVL